MGDITHLPTDEGWLYLATTIDLHTREVVGHAMATHMRAQLVADAVTLAYRRGLVAPEAIFHSDRRPRAGSSTYRNTPDTKNTKTANPHQRRPG